jgi:hypothetical protein
MLAAVRCDHRTVALTAAPGGLLLGLLDFVWIKWVPYPFAELGNSTATWAVAAFAFGYLPRSGPVRAALGAAALLVVAVPSYYVTATLLQGDDLAVVWAPTSLLWMAFGVLAGVVFGVGGDWTRRDGARQVLGTALPTAVFFAEAARFAARIGEPGQPAGVGWTVAIDVALGILAAVLVGGSNRRRALASAAAVPVAVAIFAGFAVAAGI